MNNKHKYWNKKKNNKFCSKQEQFPKKALDDLEVEAISEIKESEELQEVEQSNQNEAKCRDLEAQNAALKAQVELLETKLFNTEAEVISLKSKFEKANSDLIEKSKELSVKASEQLKVEQEKNAQLLKLELENIKMYGNQSFYENILPIFARFDAAIKMGIESNNEAISRFCYGFELLKKQMEDVFEDNGIKQLSIQVGEEYDASKASVTMFDENAPQNQIVAILAKGYMLHDRIIVPASVKIGTKGEENE